MGAAVFVAMALYADFSKVAASIKAFPASGWPFILALSLGNYFIRVVKWDFYLTHLGITTIGKTSSALIFFAGFIMAITPGKMGEVLKSLLIYEHYGIAVTRTAPVVFAERLTDVLALLFLSGAGILFAFTSGGSASAAIDGTQLLSLAAAAALCAGAVLVISSERLMKRVLKKAEDIRFLHKHIVHIEELFDSAREVLRPWPLFYATLLSILAWALECYSLYYIVAVITNAAGFSLAAMMLCTFAYSLSTIVGALAMLPGGLFVTEGGMAFLMVKLLGLTAAQAVAAAFMVRVATLWFALFIGIFALPAFNWHIGRNGRKPAAG